jgi:hypothetical protein
VPSPPFILFNFPPKTNKKNKLPPHRNISSPPYIRA